MLFTYKKIKSLNPTENYILNYIIAHPMDVIYMNVRDLADAVNVSTATLVRFTQSLGCTGFPDFKKQFTEYINGAHLTNLDTTVENVHQEFLRYTASDYKKKINHFAKAIMKAKLTAVYGIGKSAGLAIYAARSLTDIGYTATPITDPFYPVLRADPTNLFFIFISHSGETIESVAQLNEYKKKGAVIGCITAHPESTIATQSDYVLDYRGMDIYLLNTYNLSSELSVLFLMESVVNLLLKHKIDSEGSAIIH